MMAATDARLQGWRRATRRLPSRAMLSTSRFLRQYLRPDPHAVHAQETHYERDAVRLPARVYRPAEDRSALPAWVVLHGITRTGREHAGLDRFARAFAAAGNLVFVPDVPEWRALQVAPAVTRETIRCAVRAVQSRSDVRHGHVGLLAFSFGATQAVAAGADPEIAGLLHGIVGWGGYYDLRRAFHFGFTGEYELDGVASYMDPDPYGAWILAGNYLTRVPGHARDEPAAHALQALAIEAGERGFYAWDPVYDDTKRRLRATLASQQRELFDYLAPLTDRPRPDPSFGAALAAAIAEAALAADPLLDPRPSLPQLRVPVLLAHGRDDRLIPYTETIRMARAVPADRLRACTVTALFAHSGGRLGGLPLTGYARETVRFLALMHRILHLV
jgi:dienelactone hydrolase